MGIEGVGLKPEGASRAFAPIAEVPITQIDVLWITAGLGSDGETIAMTPATHSSIEDIVTGGVPWIPTVNLLNPFLAISHE
jgi:hypothetical protein